MADVHLFLRDLRRLDRTGAYFYSVNRYVVVASGNDDRGKRQIPAIPLWISSLLAWVYATVVMGLAWRVKRWVRKRSFTHDVLAASATPPGASDSSLPTRISAE